MSLSTPSPAQTIRFLDLPPAYLTAQQCNFNLIGSSDIITGRLTSGWAQEAVGLPEVREFLKRRNITLRTVHTGIIDVEYNNDHIDEYLGGAQEFEWQGVPHSTKTHGSNVALMISGPDRGMAANAHISALYVSSNSTKKEMVNLLKDQGQPLEVVNRSLRAAHTFADATRMDMQHLSELSGNSRPFVVNSAGNSYTASVLDLVQDTPASLFGDMPTLLVSAVTADGRMAEYSGGGPEVFVSAPSSGKGHNGVVHNQMLDGDLDFGGTSGAAPMVAGALASVLGITQGLTLGEIQTLLQHTNYLTARGFQEGRSFGGYGVLNFYKLVRVAERLKQSGWPENRHRILHQGAGSIYDFKETALLQMGNAKNYIQNNPQPSCAHKLEVLKMLREAFFLDPHNVGVRQALYALYVNEGYHDQGLYFSPLGYRFHGPGVASSYLLERELLQAVASGHFDKARQLLLQGRSNWESLLRPNLVHTYFSLSEVYHGEERDQFLKKTIQSIPENLRERMLLLSTTSLYNLEITRLLLESGVHPDVKDIYERTALSLAVRRGDIPGAELLLKSGAAMDVRDAAGKTLLMWGILTKSAFDISKLLLSYNANPNDQAIQGSTALMHASANGKANVVRLLLENGALPNMRDNSGRTALMWAAEWDHTEVIRILLQHGARVDLKDNEGRAVTQWARGSATLNLLKSVE